MLDLLKSLDPVRHLRLSGSNTVSVPRVKSGEAAFSFYAPGLISFKNSLKTFLLSVQ